jgi:hypothetical protein
MQQLSSDRTDFYEIFYWVLALKSVKKVEVGK